MIDDETPPFVLGQLAAKAGEPSTANPYKPESVKPDDYPCDFEKWLSGWRLVTWTREHDRRKI